MADQKPRKIRASTLVMDYDIYPREQIQTFHVNEMVHALEAGVTLPPITVEEGSKRIVDGFHRVRAYLKHFGPKASIPAIMKTYASEAELYVEAVSLNASHGANLSPYDRTRCIIRAEELGIEPSVMATALNTTIERIESIRANKIATFQKEPRALKKTASHFAGKTLTEEQDAYVKKAGGMNQLFYVNQVILMIETDSIDWENVGLIDRLKKLHGLLETSLTSVAS